MFIFGILWKGTKILSRGDAETIEYLTRLVYICGISVTM